MQIIWALHMSYKTTSGSFGSSRLGSGYILAAAEPAAIFFCRFQPKAASERSISLLSSPDRKSCNNLLSFGSRASNVRCPHPRPRSILRACSWSLRAMCAARFFWAFSSVRLLEISTRCRCSGESLSFSQDVMMPSNIPGTGCPALCVQGYLMKARTICLHPMIWWMSTLKRRSSASGEPPAWQNVAAEAQRLLDVPSWTAK